ncbi:hypothetical protein ACI784_20840 [Geodermatophilus sp. SYSU D01186]
MVVLLVAAAGLSTAGAVATRQTLDEAPDETRARRAIVELGLLAAATGLAAVAGALLGAGGTGREQFAAFAGAAAVVALPLPAVGMVRRVRRTGRHGASS